MIRVRVGCAILVWIILAFRSALISAAVDSTDAKEFFSPDLRIFLQNYVSADDIDASHQSVRYSISIAHLAADRKQAQLVVYLMGRDFCGTSGCRVLILTPENTSYRVVADIGGWLPVRVLRGVNNGWHDIGVWVEGGGITRGYIAVLRFDGSSYPDNPTLSSARPWSDVDGPGQVLDLDSVGALLFDATAEPHEEKGVGAN